MKNAIKLLIPIVLALVFTLTCCGQDTPQIKNLDDDLQPLVEANQLPALATVAISDGEIIAEGVAGVPKYGDATPVTINDQFHLGSCTKAFTATLIAILVEQDKLDWDTTMAEYYPELADQMLPRYRNVTLLHLLSHYAGLPAATFDNRIPPGTTWNHWYGLTEPIKQQRYEYTKGFLCRLPGPEVDELPEPGTGFLYSNAGYVIAGALAEHVTGKSWEELIDTLLFQPLGMTTAGFGPMGTGNIVDQPWQHLDSSIKLSLPEVVKQLHSDLLSSDDKITPVSPDTPIIVSPPVIKPAGDIHLSLRDWAKFVIMHMKGERGGSALLKPETFKILHSPPFGEDYALGWAFENSFLTEEKVYTHDGSNGLNYAFVWISMEHDFAVLVATNINSRGAGIAVDEVLLTQFENRFPEE